MTQVLNDGTNQYLYGAGRIAQVNTTTEYFLGDALGSVRQLTDASGEITLAKSYQPYGDAMSSVGSGSSPFAFTGEQQDVSGLTYLRARYYSSDTGRFITRDMWSGFDNSSLSQNKYIYGFSNPIMYTDSGGNNPCFIALGLVAVDGPAPVGDVAGLIICLRYLAAIGLGLTGLDYVANGPQIPGGVREVPEIIPLNQILANCWVIIRPKQNPSPKSDPWKVPFPAKIPLATQTSEPEYIYREGPDRAKSLRLYRIEDLNTGLSFSSFPFPPPKGSIKFKADKLRANGYVVNFDGNSPSVLLPFYGGGYSG